MRRTIAYLLAACALVTSGLLASPAQADCAAPDRPRVEEVGLSKRLNVYQEGAGFCVAAKTEYCPECEVGWWHVCKAGKWIAEHYRTCPDPVQPMPSAATGPASFLPIGNANPPPLPDSPSQKRNVNGAGYEGRAPATAPGAIPPVSGACRITNTC